MSPLTHRFQLGSAIFAGSIALFVVWYLTDATDSARSYVDLIVILPVSLLVILLCLVVIAKDIVAGIKVRSQDIGEAQGGSVQLYIYIALCLYAVLLPALGIAVSTLIFTFSSLYILGERRLVFALCFSVLFAMAISFAARFVISPPDPLILDWIRPLLDQAGVANV